jgi:hypothetical protein
MKEIGELELAIQGGTEKIEQLGEQGLVEESMNELRAVEALKVEKADKEASALPGGISMRLTVWIARTTKPYRNFRCFRSSEATSVRCVRSISFRVGQ